MYDIGGGIGIRWGGREMYMIEYCFTFRSITTAQRGQRVLERNGISSRLVRTPKSMAEQGCGYCLRLPLGQGETAAAELNANGVAYKRVYQRRSSGEITEVVL